MVFNGTDLRTHECLQCSKYRLYLPIGQSPSEETEIKELPNGEKKAFYKDICEFCQLKNYNLYFKPKQSDIKKVLKAIEKGKTEKSLEELL